MGPSNVDSVACVAGTEAGFALILTNSSRISSYAYCSAIRVGATWPIVLIGLRRAELLVGKWLPFGLMKLKPLLYLQSDSYC